MSSSVFDESTDFTLQWVLIGQIPGQPQLARIVVNACPFVVGRRGEGTHLRLPDPHVSGRHASISEVRDGLHVRDLASANGTFVRGQRIDGPTLVGDGDRLAFAGMEFRVERVLLPKEDTDLGPGHTSVSAGVEQDWTLSNFARLLQPGSIVPAFQPLVDLADGEPFGYEALARSDIPGLKTPAAMFRASQLVDQCAELSLVCRRESVAAAREFPAGTQLWLNTHPCESLEEQVFPSLCAARHAAPHLSLVVEVHEDLSADMARLQIFSKRIKKLGIGLALDDFGSGRSRQREALNLQPDFIKFDRSMICDLESMSLAAVAAMRSLLNLLHGLGIRSVAEGISTSTELQSCRDIGFGAGQGFFLGRPTSASDCLQSQPRGSRTVSCESFESKTQTRSLVGSWVE